MSRRARWLGVVLIVTSRAAAGALPPLAASVEATFATGVHVVVAAENVGGEPLREVSAEVRYRLVERRGEPVALAPGERHRWEVDFAAPEGPRGDPLIVLLRWQDPAGGRHSLPYARAVETPGLLPTEAQVLLEPEPAQRHERAVVRITNATPAPLRARLVALIPEEFFTTPAAQPVEVPPRQSVAVPIDVQSHGPRGTTYPLHAILQFEQGGIPRVIVASTSLGIGATPSRAALRPLAVGSGALALAVAGLLVAQRAAARRRHVDGPSRPT